MIGFRFVILLATIVAVTAILDKIPKPKIPKIPELPKPKIPKVKEIKDKLLGEVCYGELGCFSIRSPWNLPILERGLVGLPDSPDNIGTEFRFFSPKNVDQPQYISTANFSSWDVKKSGFKHNCKNNIYHTWLQKWQFILACETKECSYKKGESQCIRSRLVERSWCTTICFTRVSKRFLIIQGSQEQKLDISSKN
uniref:U42-Eretoxin-Ek1c_1 n=1 Tax=Eresus cinnaberinus TaxID=175337 RepID=A0A2D0PDS8_ERECI